MNPRLSRRRFVAGGMAFDLGLGLGADRSVHGRARVAPGPPPAATASLDLAGLLLGPDDLDQPSAGLHAYRWSVPAYRLFGEIVRTPARVSHEPPSRYVDRLRAAGWQREAQATVAPPGERPSPVPAAAQGITEVDLVPPLPAVEVFSRIVEFRDAASAAAGFPVAWLAYDRTFAGATQTGKPSQQPMDRRIGDEARLAHLHHQDVDGSLFWVVRLAFRCERLVAIVEVVDHTGPADAALVETLAGKLERRLRGALAGGRSAPGLADRVVRLGGDDVAPIGLEGYLLRDDRLVPVFAETAEQYRRREASFGGAVAAYSRFQSVAGVFPPDEAGVHTGVLEFAGPTAAAAWFAGQKPRGAGLIGTREGQAGVVVAEPRVIPPSRSIGDEVLIVGGGFATDGLRGRRAVLVARRGHHVFEMVLTAVGPGSPIPGLEALAAAQVALLDAGGDSSPLRVPAGLIPS